jgi:hypothetical protein
MTSRISVCLAEGPTVGVSVSSTSCLQDITISGAGVPLTECLQQRDCNGVVNGGAFAELPCVRGGGAYAKSGTMAQWYDRACGDAALQYLWQQIDPVGTIVPLVCRCFEAGMGVWIDAVGPNRHDITLNWRTRR